MKEEKQEEKQEEIIEPIAKPSEETKESDTSNVSDKSDEVKADKVIDTKDNETVEALRAELLTITEKAERIPTLEQELSTVKIQTEKQATLITEYETLVTKLVETKMSQVPSEYTDLIPSNLSLTQKLDWLDKAESKGLFKQDKQDKPNVEIGKPMNVEPKQADTSKLFGGSLLRHAYNTIRK